MDQEQQPVCEVCKKPVVGDTYDLWVLLTRFDKDFSVRATGLNVDVDNDYVIVGVDCCGEKVLNKWVEFTNSLINGE